MITIAKNEQYEFLVDIVNNRAFLTIKEFWRNEADIPGYLEDWDQALDMLKPGFTLLTDATNMSIHPGEVRDIHQRAQEKIISAGVQKVAELHYETVAVMQLNGLASESGLPRKNFTDRKEARVWLESA